MSKTSRRTRTSDGKNTIIVRQSANARTGQGGNAFAINGSDVGVVKTVVNNNSKK